MQLVARKQRNAKELAQTYVLHYKQVFDYSEQALLLFTPEGQILEWNPKTLEIFDLSGDDINQITASDLGLSLVPPQQLSEEHSNLALVCQQPKGNSFPARVSFTAHQTQSGPLAILVSITDLSSLIKSQEERLKPSKRSLRLVV